MLHREQHERSTSEEKMSRSVLGDHPKIFGTLCIVLWCGFSMVAELVVESVEKMDSRTARLQCLAAAILSVCVW